MPLLNTADAVYLGAQPVDAVYLGAAQVWAASGGAWGPSNIAGLAAWFDASQDTFTDGQAITTYVEHSSAAREFYALAGNQPVFRAGGGKPYLEHPASATSGGFTSTALWNAGTAGLTFVCVCRIEGGSYPMFLVWGPEANGFEMRHDGSAQQIVLMYSSYGIYFSNATPSGGGVDHLYMLRVQPPGPAEAWTNANRTTGSSPPTMPNVAQSLYMGRRQGGYPFIGRMYEALVYAGPISEADRLALNDYLREKWGLG